MEVAIRLYHMPFVGNTIVNVMEISLTDDYVFIYSGYGISAQALTAVIRAHDGRGPETMLTSTILKALGLSSPDELIGYSILFVLVTLDETPTPHQMVI